VLVLGGSILTLFFVPWLDTSKVRSARFRPMLKQFFWALVVVCIILGYCGSQSADAVVPNTGIPLVWVARLCTLYYFGYFWLVLPLLGLIETPKALPDSIAKAVLGHRVPTSQSVPVAAE
jgi:quinol-cytochrome oxidoreductase complex cytochrome b subunit